MRKQTLSLFISLITFTFYACNNCPEAAQFLRDLCCSTLEGDLKIKCETEADELEHSDESCTINTEEEIERACQIFYLTHEANDP